MSLHRAKGAGKQSRFVEPSQREGFALTVGAIMQWSRLRDCSNPMFFTNMVQAVKDCEGTERNWQEDDIKFFVTQRVFGGIPQYAVEQWIQRAFMGIKGPAIVTKRAEIIENFIYKYLSTVDAGVGYEEAHELGVKANIDEILRCKALGGHPEWSLTHFLSREPWDEVGGKAGLKVVAKKLLTLVAAGGRKHNGQPAPIDPICGKCGELTLIHLGDRCKLDPIPCKCNVLPAEEMPKTEDKRQKGVKRTRDFDQVWASFPALAQSASHTQAPHLHLTHCAAHTLRVPAR